MGIMQEKAYSDTRIHIRSVLITYPSGVSFDEFHKSYRTYVDGKGLPSRSLGFNSHIDLLKSMPDVVHVSTNNVGKVILTGIADGKCEHIQKLVQKQRTTATKPRTISNKAKSSTSPRNLPNRSSRPPFIPGSVRAEMLQLANIYPDGITLPNFVLAYRDKFNKYLLLEQGLETLEKMVNLVTDLEIKMVRNEKKIFLKSQNTSKRNQMVSIAKKDRSQECEDQVEDARNQSFDNSGIPENVQNNMKLVLKKCPDGISAIHFPVLYENFTGESFNLHELGYSSLVNLVDSLPKIFKRTSDPTSSKTWVIYPADSETNHSSKGLKSLQLNSTHKKSSRSDSDYSSSPPSHRKHCTHVPDDCASPLSQFEDPKMPDDVDLSNLPVFVSAIVSPGLFWFHLQTNEAIDELETLEHDLESSYADYYSTKYHMADSDIIIGATCIVLCPDDNLFYRAVIKSIPSIDLVNIFFIDYGSRENVPRTHLRYVRHQFLDYPAHAFKGHLRGLRPPNNDASWGTKAQQRFIDLCECASLMATIKQVDSETFSVELCDMNKGNQININEVLVEEGHANFGLDIPLNKHTLSNSVSTVNNVYDSNFTLMASTVTIPELSSYSDSEQRPIGSKEGDSELNLSLDSARISSFSPEKQDSDIELEVSEVPGEHFQKRYVKLLKLCKDSSIHIINYEDKPYVSADELSKLFWDDKDAAYLAERLNFKDVEVPTKEISRLSNLEVFKQCSCFKLLDLESNASSLCLYPLDWAFKILNILGHPSSCVRFAIRNEIESFDPNDSIWKDFIYADDLDDLEKEIEEKLGKLCLYDLKTKKEALRLRRLKLVRISADASADEIRRIDHMQFIIERRIQHIESICSQFSS